MLSIKTAWMKYYYPEEFMAAILNSYIGKSEKLQAMLFAIKRMGIEILPPDINESDEYFSVENGAIRFGFRGLRGVGASSPLIEAERKARGEFRSLQEFGERMASNQDIGKAVLDGLIYSGAVDSFAGTRNAKITVMSELLHHLSGIKKENKNKDQMSFFDFLEEEDIQGLMKEITTPVMDEMDKGYKLEKEKEYAGLYVTEHPLDEYAAHFDSGGLTKIASILEAGEEEEGMPLDEEIGGGTSAFEKENEFDGKRVKLAGIVKDLQIFYTKKDQKPIHVFQLEDYTGEIKGVVFDSSLEANRQYLKEGTIVFAEGIIDVDDFGSQLIVKQLTSIAEFDKFEKPKLIWLSSNDKEKIQKFLVFAQSRAGEVPMNIVYQDKGYRSKQKLSLDYATFSALEEWFGNGVKIDY